MTLSETDKPVELTASTVMPADKDSATADPQTDESAAEAAVLLLIGVLLAGAMLLTLLVAAVRWSRRAVQRQHLSTPPAAPPTGPAPPSLADGPLPGDSPRSFDGSDDASGDTRIDPRPGETLAD